MGLFSPLVQRSLTLKNRIVVSPMCQYSSEDGFANDWHLVHLGTRAVGGAGTIIVESTAIEPNGRISPRDLGLWKDEHIEFLRRITEFVRAQGSVIGIQLGHAGRKASTRAPWIGGGIAPAEEGGWPDVVSSSPDPYSDQYLTPRELSIPEIHQVIQDFGDATARALRAGFQIVEIHGAHGYLLHQFLSPLINRRTDEYGGSFENRTRIVREVYQVVRDIWPADLPVWIRLSATDWVDGGWNPDDTVRLAHALPGIDLVDCSSGGAVPGASIPIDIGYQVPFARAIKESGVPSGAVGMIRDPSFANEIITAGKADLVLLAREMLRSPYWPLVAAKALDADLPWPKQYERARD